MKIPPLTGRIGIEELRASAPEVGLAVGVKSEVTHLNGVCVSVVTNFVNGNLVNKVLFCIGPQLERLFVCPYRSMSLKFLCNLAGTAVPKECLMILAKKPFPGVADYVFEATTPILAQLGAIPGAIQRPFSLNFS